MAAVLPDGSGSVSIASRLRAKAFERPFDVAGVDPEQPRHDRWIGRGIDDCQGLEHRSIVRFDAVEACPDEVGRRSSLGCRLGIHPPHIAVLHDHAALDEVVEQFVHEQWGSARPGGDQVVDPRDHVSSQSGGDDGVDRRPIEPAETNDRGPRRATEPGDQMTQLRAPFRLVGSSRHDDQQRRIREVETQVLQDLDAGLIGPVQVVQRQHHRLLGADPGDQRGERVLGADLERLAGADRRLQIEAFDQRTQRGQPGGQPGDVFRRARPQVTADGGDERLVRDRRRQLPRPSVEDVVATGAGRLQHGGDERALAGAALSLDHDERAFTAPARRETREQQISFRLSPDWRVGHCVPLNPYVPTEYVQGTDAPLVGTWLSVHRDPHSARPVRHPPDHRNTSRMPSPSWAQCAGRSTAG